MLHELETRGGSWKLSIQGSVQSTSKVQQKDLD